MRLHKQIGCLIRLSIWPSVLLIALFSSPSLAEAANVNPSNISGAPGESVVLLIDIDEPVSGMTDWGLDIYFDTSVLEYSDYDKTDTLSASLAVNGIARDFGARVGAYSTGASVTGGPGALLKVILNVKSNAYKNSTIQLKNFVDYIEGFSSTDSTFTITGVTVSVNLTPSSVDDVVAGDAVTLTAEVLVNGSPLDLTDPGDVNFVTSGNGTFGTKSVVNGNVEVNYTTPTLVETATITATETVSGGDNQDASAIASIAGELATLTVSPDSLTLTADDTQLFTVSGVDANGNPVSNLGTITWSVNGAIGTIDNTGLFDATTEGTGSVTATSDLGPSDTSGDVIVNPGAFVVLTVSPDTAALIAGQTQQFSVEGTDSDGNIIPNLGTITWDVDGNIGTIDSTGLFTAITAGSGSIVASSDLGPSDTTDTITVDAGPLAILTVSPDTDTITADDTIQFTVTGKDASDNPVQILGNITWSVNGGIGTIDSDGLFTATSVGTGYVTATSDIDTISDDSGDITVNPGVLATLTVNPDTTITLTADETQQFTVSGKDADDNDVTDLGNITWSVDANIGTIDNTGLFDATIVGSGTVTATSDIGPSDSSRTVTVNPGVLATLTVGPETPTLTADDTQQFSVSGVDADGNDVTVLGTITWSVNGGIGTIDSNGLFNPITVGTGSVTATSDIDSVSDDSGVITVNPGVLAALTASPDTATLTADETQQFNVSGVDADGNAVTVLGTITWSVDGGIGTIDPSGLFNAITVGTGSVTATSDIDSVSDTSGAITVTPGVLATLTVDPETATLTADDTQQFNVSGVDADGNAVTVLGTITWSVNGGIGTIDPSGLFNAITVGTGSVTATSDIDSVSDDSGQITVTPGAAAQIDLTSNRNKIASEGKGTANLIATVRDNDGNVKSDLPLTTFTFTVTGDVAYAAWTTKTSDTVEGIASLEFASTGDPVPAPPAPPTTVSIVASGASLTSNSISIEIVNFSAAAEFDALVTAGTPHETSITAIGAENEKYKWEKLSGNGTLSAPTPTSATVTFTAPSSITEGISGHPTKIRVSDVDNPGVDYEFTITTYEPVTFTDPTAPIGITHDGNVKTYQLVVTGGDGDYTYQVQSGSSDVITVDDQTGLVSAVAAGGPKTVLVIDGNGDFAVDNSFRALSVEIEVVDGIVVTPDAETLRAGETLQYGATGAKGEGVAGNYTWSVDNTDAASIDPNGLLQAKTVDNVQVTVTATDETYTNIFGSTTLTIYEDVGFSNMPEGYDPDDPNTWPVVESGDSYDFGDATGGKGPFTWSVDGPIPIAPFEAESFEFVPETTGPFAGAYAVEVCDSNPKPWCRSVMVKVPLVFEPYSKNIIGLESFDLVLKGADPDAEISEGIFLDENSNEIPEEEMDDYATVTPELPIAFVANSTATSTVTGADAVDLKVFKIEVLVTGDPDLTEENGLDIATTGWIRVMPVVTFEGVVQDADTGEPIDGATILFKLADETQAQATSAADGTFFIEDLVSPDMNGAEYIVLVFAPGYLMESTTTEGWVNPQTIELTQETDAVTGTVTESGSGNPIAGARVESTVDDEPIVAYTDAAGSYTLSLPVATDALPEGLEARASKSGYLAQTKEVVLSGNPNFILEPQAAAFPQQVCEDGGSFFDAECRVSIPGGTLDACYELNIDPSIAVGVESLYTKNSSVLVAVDLSDPADPNKEVDLAEPIAICMPFDTTDVNPGDFKAGSAVIYHAPTADDLRNGTNVKSVPTADIISEDHINELVCFWVSELSAFGAGGAQPVVAGGGGGAGG